MTKGQLEKAYLHARAEMSRVNDELIAAGRGHELASETRKQTDPLSERWRVCDDRLFTITSEASRRMRYHGSTHRVIRREP